MKTPQLPSLYTQTQSAVEEYINQVFERRIDEASTIGDQYVHFWKTIQSVFSYGGKRARPYLTMVGYGSFDARVVAVAAAQELVHTAMLIHDDIIDQDIIRHGHENVSGTYLHRYANLSDVDLRKHYANSAATLAGDALLSEAYHAVGECDISPSARQRVLTQLHQSVYEVIGGELMDVEAPLLSEETFDPLAISRYKTASYSFIGPLLSGSYCAQANQETIEALRLFGEYLGIAFQLQDDLLGVFGDEAKTGKSTVTDLLEAKATLLVQAHKNNMNTEQAARFYAIFGNANATHEDLASLKADMVESGARKATEDAVNRYFDHALEVADKLKDPIQKKELQIFAKSIQHRSA